MNIDEIKQTLKQKEYDFLKNNEHLGNNIMLITLGGSYAYGMNKEGSDLDIRGIAFNSKKEVLLGKDFGQVVDNNTDTTIYSTNKMLELLTSNNPNTIEILGGLPEHYMYKTRLGEELIANRKMFLSKLCIHTFGGYANAQLRRLQNKTIRTMEQAKHEEFILNSIKNAEYAYKPNYFPYNEGSIKLYTDTSDREDFESEIYMDLHLEHYPLRDWTGMWNEMKAIVSSYNKMGKRNQNAISHDKLGKHMGHLLRLYMMCIDILEKEEIITYRKEEHDVLMKARNGGFLENGVVTQEFLDILEEYNNRFEYAKENTSLPELPDYERINEFKFYMNELIVKGLV